MDREKIIETLESILDADNYDCWLSRGERESVCDAVDLLKEQEAVTPYIDIDEAKCPTCKVKLTRQELIGDDVLFEDFFDYCPHCGRPVKWE